MRRAVAPSHVPALPYRSQTATLKNAVQLRQREHQAALEMQVALRPCDDRTRDHACLVKLARPALTMAKQNAPKRR